MQTASVNCWLNIIHRGRKTSTYKLAMGFAICGFVDEGKRHIGRRQMAEAFLDLYAHRLENCMPQLSDPSKKTVMETIVEEWKAGSLNRDQAVTKVAGQAFADVIDSFHIVDGLPVSLKFYERQGLGITLTDHAYHVFRSPARTTVLREMDFVWSELESAFARRRATENSSLWVAGVGSIMKRRFGWCSGDIRSKRITKKGGDIREFVDGIAADISAGRKVALGFACPLWVPIAAEPESLGKARAGESPRSWSATTGCLKLALGVVQLSWVLRGVKETVRQRIRPTLNEREFLESGRQLFLWEASVSKPVGGTETDGAEAGARAFLCAGHGASHGGESPLHG